MKLLMVDGDGATVQEYEGVTAQADGAEIECGTLMARIPGEADGEAGAGSPVTDEFRAALAAELARIKRESFTEGYQASDAEAFGLMTARFFTWDGVDIMQAGAYALEDANFHTECAQLQDMAKQAGG